METVGILPRDGAWLKDVPPDRFHILPNQGALHWGSLLAGTKRGWLADPEKKNKVLQMSIAKGVSGCKRYHHTLPSVHALFLLDLGNIVNEEATATTWVEGMTKENKP